MRGPEVAISSMVLRGKRNEQEINKILGESTRHRNRTVAVYRDCETTPFCVGNPALFEKTGDKMSIEILVYAMRQRNAVTVISDIPKSEAQGIPLFTDGDGEISEIHLNEYTVGVSGLKNIIRNQVENASPETPREIVINNHNNEELLYLSHDLLLCFKEWWKDYSEEERASFFTSIGSALENAVELVIQKPPIPTNRSNGSLI